MSALPAGAGKTTLMDVLACRKTAGRMEGQVMVGSAATQLASSMYSTSCTLSVKE
jgi:ABC-type uncharacterized transport system ATPase subunit